MKVNSASRDNPSLTLPAASDELGPHARQPLDVQQLTPRILLASFYVHPAASDFDIWIPGVNIYLILHGQMRFWCSDGAVGTAGPGSLVTFYAGRNGYTVSENEAISIYQVIFQPAAPPFEYTIPHLEEIGSLPHVLHVGPDLNRFIGPFERMVQSLLQLRPAWRIETASAILDLIGLAFGLVSHRKPSQDCHLTDWQCLLLRLEEETELPLTVRQLARDMGWSVQHFISKFRRHFGKTPKQYCIDRRLWQAYQLLADGAAAKVAASKAGFQDPSHFNRMFKRHFGHCPGETRARRARRVADDPFRDLSLPSCHHLFAPGVNLSLFRVTHIQRGRRVRPSVDDRLLRSPDTSESSTLIVARNGQKKRGRKSVDG
ncbi:MAG: AraC family transcriptional regulator [Kiritimatiellae bacterium]|nr:AraC family transcriptional regulator [Kiritimatiellia bacterium]